MVRIKSGGGELTEEVRFILAEVFYLWMHQSHKHHHIHAHILHSHTVHERDNIPHGYCNNRYNTMSPLFCWFCFNICSVSSGLCVMSFNTLNTHHLFGWHRCLPMTALLWKLSRWLLHIRPDLPVALAKPMLTVGLFHSLILKSRFGPPPTLQNTPRCPQTWSRHAVTQCLITVSEVG